MLNSRDIDLLRPDVAANCRKFIELCKKEGYPVLVTGTVRDDEFQMQCYEKGTSRSKVPTFHSVKAGLAFDVCKNVKGEEYSDKAFWTGISKIGKKMGFEWGGDWKKIVDKPHFQWSGPNHEYTASMILRGEYPPEMPLYEEDDMTQEKFNEMMNNYLAGLCAKDGSSWSEEARQFCIDKGLFIGGDPNENGEPTYMWRSYMTREAFAQVMMRLFDLMGWE